MMKPADGDTTEKEQKTNRRNELPRTLQRDFERHRRRDISQRTFWRWLGVLGMVGWPIAIMTVGGALLGHYLDVRFNSGIQFTLMLLTAGVIVGSWVAWKAIGTDK